MSENKRVDKAAVAPTALSRMSDEERKAIRAEIQRALDERDLPRVPAGLAGLGLDETANEYQGLLHLWHEHAHASRWKLPERPLRSALLRPKEWL